MTRLVSGCMTDDGPWWSLSKSPVPLLLHWFKVLLFPHTSARWPEWDRLEDGCGCADGKLERKKHNYVRPFFYFFHKNRRKRIFLQPPKAKDFIGWDFLTFLIKLPLHSTIAINLFVGKISFGGFLVWSTRIKSVNRCTIPLFKKIILWTQN